MTWWNVCKLLLVCDHLTPCITLGHAILQTHFLVKLILISTSTYVCILITFIWQKFSPLKLLFENFNEGSFAGRCVYSIWKYVYQLKTTKKGGGGGGGYMIFCLYVYSLGLIVHFFAETRIFMNLHILNSVKFYYSQKIRVAFLEKYW